VVPDPNARFQRFGVENNQLFGKPINLTVADYRPSVPAWAAATPAPAPAQTPAKAQAQTTPALAPDYTRAGGSLTRTGAATTGRLVNLTA
jgi:hypothetical protein